MKLQIGRENTRRVGLVRDENEGWRNPTEAEKASLFAPWSLVPDDPNTTQIQDGDGDWIAGSDNSSELIVRFNMLSRELQLVKASQANTTV